MGKFNTYRYLVLDDVDDLKGNGRRRHRSVGKSQRLFVLCLFIGIILFIGFYTSLFYGIIELLAAHLGFAQTMYAVVVDTNHIRSELYIYKFHKHVFDNKLCLDKDTFIRSKPGLSSLIYDNDLGDQLHVLLKQSCKTIDFDKSVATPLVFKISSIAETDQSLMNVYQVNDVLKGYYNYISSIGSPFLMRREYFSILKKSEEVVDVWIAVNLLLDNSNLNLAVLDMDDDSLHMAVQTNGKDNTLNHTDIQVGTNGRVPLFVKSYPNLGLMAARLGVLRMENPTSVDRFNSSCINPIINEQMWKYKSHNYYISGPSDPQYLVFKETWISVSSRVPVVNSSKCLDLVQRYVNKQIDEMSVPKLSKEQALYLFGHFFTQASDVGLIDVMKGGKLTVQRLHNIRTIECNSPNIDQPWVCFDLIYLYVLLERIIGKEARFQLSRNIIDNQISWTLGAAYRILNNLIESEF